MKVCTWGDLFKITASQWKSTNPFGKSCRTVPGKVKFRSVLIYLIWQRKIFYSPLRAHKTACDFGIITELSTVGFSTSWAIYAICMDGWFPMFTVMLHQEGGTKSLTCLWSLKRSLIMLQGETTFMTLWHSVKIQQLLQWLTASQLEFQVGWDQSIGLRPYHHPI